MRRLLFLAILVLSLASCRSAAPTEPTSVGLDVAPTHLPRVPTVTSVAFLPNSATLNVQLDRFHPNSLGKQWTFALNVGSRWIYGPGLAEYLAWVDEELADQFLVGTGFGPDCAGDAPIGYAPGAIASRSSIRVVASHLVQGVGVVRGRILIFDAVDMRSPWIPLPACHWESREPLTAVQAFAFEAPFPVETPMAAGTDDIVPPRGR